MSRSRKCSDGGFREQSGVAFVRPPLRSERRAGASESALSAKMQPELASQHADPRRRRDHLLHRFLEAGPAGILDLEMLELVLCRAIPQRDAGALARRLIAAFGDYNGVISAPSAWLSNVRDVDAEVICELKLVEASAHRLARTRVMNRHALSNWPELINYCTTTMAHREVEHFRVLFLDRKNVLIADEEQGRGTVDHVPAYPREVVKRALELNASAVILVHNHPSGDPTPSTADIDMTRQIRRAAKSVGIVVHDHVIVGREGHTSLRSQGLI